jgi:DNA-binding protein HU-beta
MHATGHYGAPQVSVIDPRERSARDETFPHGTEAMMTKDEFAEKLANKTEISKAKAHEAIDAIFATEPGKGIIAVELDAGRDFTITGFGTFYTRERAARRGRNPKTGESLMIPAMRLAAFRAGKGLKERVRR